MEDIQKLILKTIEDFKADNSEGHKQMIKRLDYANGNIMKNTAFRLETIGGLNVMKWILGFVGIGTLANIILIFVK